MRLTKIKKTYLVAVAALAVGAMICLPRFASAAVTGQCSNCHTMHNSQNGVPMTFATTGTTTGYGTTGTTATPNDVLLRGNCLQCHTGTNTGAVNSDAGVPGAGGTPPYVFSGVTAPIYSTSTVIGNTLAGGNFWWADQSGNTADGHNVYELPDEPNDVVLTSPPGYTGSLTWGTTATNHLTCAGTYGCHGDRSTVGNFKAISGAHHSDPGVTKTGIADASATPKPLTITANSFRFLNGVQGVEASNWEFTTTSIIHNEYFGVARTTTDSTVLNTANDDPTTISSLCAQCHGGFHNNTVGGSVVEPGIQGSGGNMASPWIRHPTDFDMNGLGGEYASYTVYDATVPVGNTAIYGATSNPDVAYGNADGTIVMCISCHRAHGSPYPDMLRWDYSGMIAGPAGTVPTGATQLPGIGCFKCHSTKDS